MVGGTAKAAYVLLCRILFVMLRLKIGCVPIFESRFTSQEAILSALIGRDVSLRFTVIMTYCNGLKSSVVRNLENNLACRTFM